MLEKEKALKELKSIDLKIDLLMDAIKKFQEQNKEFENYSFSSKDDLFYLKKKRVYIQFLIEKNLYVYF